MLKALELHGFKSFADKTRFEFPPGITVIVGPNGSGKSNVVDAIKWVLGEQSAKSLRGKEMADVIYKGSGSGSRKPANAAEATLLFDNSDRSLDIDCVDVSVTRRVYRSGEGEYLINGQPCRLKDLKQLFRGTGVGADAYSLIEQGKVDALLQASTQDRRALFEEAAGISRFKAKKVEAERRLERVQQNLLRLSDIVDEVDARLRKLRSQASKARRYQELSDRLQQLRTEVGRADWLHLTDKLQQAEAALADSRTSIANLSAERQQWAELVLSSESQLEQVETQLRAEEAKLADLREQLASLAAARGPQENHLREMRRDIVDLQAQELVHRQRQQQIQAQLEQLRREGDEVQARTQQQERALQGWEQGLQELAGRLSEVHGSQLRLREQIRQYQMQLSDAYQAAARVQAEIGAAEAHRESCAARRQELEVLIQAAHQELSASQQAFQRVAMEANALREQLRQQQDRTDQLRDQLHQFRQQQAHVRERRIALQERAQILHEFELRREGLGDGVREILRRAESGTDEAYRSIRGIVADLIEVTERAWADGIAAALGDCAQHIVVTGPDLLLHMEQHALDLPGRVGFIRIPFGPPPAWPMQVSLRDHPGILGRADEFVRCQPEYEFLVQWLLGDTWFVDHLSTANRLSRSIHGPVRFVTTAAQVLERDGRWLVGPPVDGTNLISRKAELREVERELQQTSQAEQQLEDQLHVWDEDYQQRQQELKQLQGEVRQAEDRESMLHQAVQTAQRRVLELEARRDPLRTDEQQWVEQLAQLRSSLQRLEQTIQTLEQQRADDQRSLEDQEQQAPHLESELSRQREIQHQCQLEFASLRQALDRCHERAAQLERELEDRVTQAQSTSARLQEWSTRCQQIEAELHASEAREKELKDQAETWVQCQAEREQGRQALVLQLQQARREVESLTAAVRAREQEQHALELQADRARLERQTLSQRLREDYGLDIAQVCGDLSPSARAERAEIDREIVELRRKLSHLGAVNMDALAELKELESRYEHLAGQYRDLTQARESLEAIIRKINADSRKLYAETLEAVRSNFQTLFRKVFGGGRADIVLDPEKDLLESGIEIVATPPGKHSLNLSLLSGGERALTAVTLLLALFQYRPSPFCVLDEVDGPLDEANIGRFIGVLQEFLQWTRFVIVTHSKKTMTAANTLYGVTMQESGISKRVSVRFEDVNEQGEFVRIEHTDDPGDVVRVAEESTGKDERGAA